MPDTTSAAARPTPGSERITSLDTIRGVAVLGILTMNVVSIDADGYGLGEYWGVAGIMSDTVGLWFISDLFFRGLGMMLIGVGAYRSGFLTGRRPNDSYVRSARWGLGFGLPLSGLGG